MVLPTYHAEPNKTKNVLNVMKMGRDLVCEQGQKNHSKLGLARIEDLKIAK